MRGRPKKGPRQKDMTERFRSGDFDEDRIEQSEQFSERHKTSQHDRMQRTAALREEQNTTDLATLPVGEVVQVFSLFCEVESAGKTYLCVVRRTLTRTTHTFVVVGDQVRFRPAPDAEAPSADASAGGQKPEGVIEQILPRKTLLTRADSFKGVSAHPIIANAEQVLLVVSIRQPYPKWGLIDRMLVAAEAGGLRPIVCLNKLDLVNGDTAVVDVAEEGMPPDLQQADAVLRHYAALGIRVLRTSVVRAAGLDELRSVLTGRTTVLAGHSGVGKSSLVRAVDPTLDLRVGEVSRYTDKGRHTTTSARKYPLSFGGVVIDTPGVKQFGLWGVTRENLEQFFPDVAGGDAAPPWRQQSFERIRESLPPADPHA